MMEMDGMSMGIVMWIIWIFVFIILVLLIVFLVKQIHKK